MSLEKNIQRIADALELIAKNMASAPVNTVAAAPAQVVAPVTQPTATTTVAAPPVQQPIFAATAPVVTAPTVSITPEELNAALVVEFTRLGTDVGIRAEMAKLGVSSVTELAPAQYGVLLAAVKALA